MNFAEIYADNHQDMVRATRILSCNSHLEAVEALEAIEPTRQIIAQSPEIIRQTNALIEKYGALRLCWYAESRYTASCVAMHEVLSKPGYERLPGPDQ
jgi:hypothetical protein